MIRQGSKLLRAPCRILCRYNSTAAATPSAPTATSTKSGIVSSAPAGTVLKGLNIRKNGEDPVALPEEEYPEWLWKLLENKPKSEDQALKSERRKANRQKIKTNNFISKMN